jgi:predicted  nucleic acid-binding Zn-ribbon protein
MEALTQKRAALLSEVETLRQKIDTHKAQEQRFQETYQHTHHEVEKLRQEVARLSAEKSRWEAQKASLQQEKQTMAERLRELHERRAACETELSHQKHEVATLRQQLEEATETYQKVEKAKIALEQELSALRRQMSTVEAELKGKVSERSALESLLRQAAHWPPALRRLLQTYPDKLLPLESVVYAEEPILPLLAHLLRLEPLTLCVSDPTLLPQIESAIAQEKEGLIQVLLPTTLPDPPAKNQPPLPNAQPLAPQIKTLTGWEALPQALWGDVWIVSEEATPPPTLRYLYPEKKQLTLRPTSLLLFRSAQNRPHRPSASYSSPIRSRSRPPSPDKPAQTPDRSPHRFPSNAAAGTFQKGTGRSPEKTLSRRKSLGPDRGPPLRNPKSPRR